MRAAQDGRRGPLVLYRMPRASVALPGAKTGAGGGVDIEGGANLAARVLLDRLLGAPRMQVFPLQCPRWGEPMRGSTVL